MAASEKIRDFRHSISILKKKGLIPSNIDARKIFPTDKISGRYASTIVNRFDDVLSEKIAVKKVKPAVAKKIRRASGYEVVRGKLLIPKSLNEKVTIKKGRVVIKHPAGLTRIQIPVEYHRLDSYFRALKRTARKKRNQYYGFRFYGNNSNDLFETIDQMQAKLKSYRVFLPGRSDGKRGLKNRTKEVEESIRHIEIVTIDNPNEWDRETDETREKRRKEKRALRSKRYRQNRKNIA